MMTTVLPGTLSLSLGFNPRPLGSPGELNYWVNNIDGLC